LWAKTALADPGAKSTQTLGIRITPEQVADKVWQSVHPTPRDRRLHRTSYSVGAQTTVLANASKFAPNFASRLINKFLSWYLLYEWMRGCDPGNWLRCFPAMDVATLTYE